MVDRFFNEQARLRKIEQARKEREAKAHAAKVARIRAELANGPKVIHLDGPIGQRPGEFSAAWLRSELPSDRRPIVLRIHSEGGSVFEAFAMFDQLADYPGPKRCEVASMAFSAASLLPCAFDDTAITKNGYMMVHAPFFDEADDELGDTERQLLDDLRAKMIDIYRQRTGKPESVIRQHVDSESYFDAEDSVAFGLVHRVASATVVAKRIPPRIVARLKPSKSATSRWRAAVDALASRMPKAKAILEVDRQNPGLRAAMLREVNRR